MLASRAMVRFVSLCVFAAFWCDAALAGPLTPPAGAPGPTMKTLQQVEPRTPIGADTTPGDAASVYKITQPGSYYLTGNVQGVAGRDGIAVAATNVTIDLNGFALNGGGVGVNGVGVYANVRNVLVTNGVVQDWGNAGVTLDYGSRVSDVRVEGCTNYGIGVLGGSVVERCAVSRCATGITATDSGVVACSASVCSVAGVSTFNGVAQGCTANSNNGAGFDGRGTAYGACSASGNSLAGFSGQRCSYDACVAVANTGSGFVVAQGTLANCSASFSSSDGFELGTGVSATGCAARSNMRHGFNLGGSCALLACVAATNGRNPGLAGCGVFASGGGSRIEGNQVLENPVGVRVTGTNNFIARNVASFNPTRTDVVAGNAMAEWVVTPGTAFSSSNAWANFGV